MDETLAAYRFFFSTLAFFLGAIVGSFLNVCIYRMPLGLSVNQPRRSFCPACKKPVQADDAWAGQEIACPICNAAMLVPQARTLD